MSAPVRSSARCAVGALAVLALAGCGGSGGAPASPGTGGTWEATLAEQSVELEDAPVVCEQVDDAVHLRIGDIRTDNPSRSTGINAVIADPTGEPTAAVVQFALPDGRNLLYSPADGLGIGVRAAEVTVEGDTYSIAGTGRLTDPSAMQATVRFAITVTCA